MLGLMLPVGLPLVALAVTIAHRRLPTDARYGAFYRYYLVKWPSWVVLACGGLIALSLALEWQHAGLATWGFWTVVAPVLGWFVALIILWRGVWKHTP